MSETTTSKATVLAQTLPQFTGTERYYRLYPGLLLTDGARYLADEAEAYWLLDVIWSHLPSVPKGEWFVCAKLERKEEGASFTLGDGNGGVYARQAIPYTDFPLEEVTLYAARQDNVWVLLLPSEY
jgi:hypothetical protein